MVMDIQQIAVFIRSKVLSADIRGLINNK